MEKNKIVVANLKMNMSFGQIKTYIDKIRTIETKRVVFCPSSLYIPYFLGYNYGVGIQQISNRIEGAYTGQISSKQAGSMGLVLTLIGHSECRTYLKESDDLINEKVKAALENKLNVILCIGETKEQREMLKTSYILKKQIISALNGLSKQELKHVYIAYEPVWAIGTNKIPSNRDIEDTIRYIKKIVEKHFDFNNIPVLYGGSINSKNIEELNEIENCSGFLVGGSSLKVKELFKIIEVALKE